jgi:multidrug resistance efflux pump
LPFNQVCPFQRAGTPAWPSCSATDAFIASAKIQHADTLRWPTPAKLRAARIVPWLQGQQASDAHVVAANTIRDMRPQQYEAATSNRSLAALKMGFWVILAPEFGDVLQRTSPAGTTGGSSPMSS